MRITSNYTMPNYNNRNCKKPNFQARVDEDVLKSLREKAIAQNRELAFNRQLDKISQWGNKDSVITVSTDMDMKNAHLALFNENISELYGGGFNIDKTKPTLEQFFRLTKNDIVDAEKEIVENSRVAKLEGIKKIVQTPEYMEEITGKENPSDNELAIGISKLSERQIMEYRFDIAKKQEQYRSAIKDFDASFEILPE